MKILRIAKSILRQSQYQEVKHIEPELSREPLTVIPLNTYFLRPGVGNMQLFWRKQLKDTYKKING